MTKLTRKMIVKYDCLHCRYYAQYSCKLECCFLEAEEDTRRHQHSIKCDDRKIQPAPINTTEQGLAEI